MRESIIILCIRYIFSLSQDAYLTNTLDSYCGEGIPCIRYIFSFNETH